jgi:hypothetical protein
MEALMKHTLLITVFCTLAAATIVTAAPIPLANWGFETNSTAMYGSADGWGPNGGWANHSGHSKPGYVAALELNFCFMSAQTTETVEQSVPQGNAFEASKIYTFWSYAMGGGDDVGEIAYQIGYTNETGFVALATDTAVLDGTWAETAGVTYNTGATGPELGQTIAVRFGDGVGVPGSSDVWFDNAQLDVVPEPTAIGLLTLAAGLFIRRR